MKAAREAMARLKFHPRDALPNATALARADALYVELAGRARSWARRSPASAPRSSARSLLIERSRELLPWSTARGPALTASRAQHS